MSRRVASSGIFQKLSAAWRELWLTLGALPPAQCLRAALLIWGVYIVIIATIVAIDPLHHSATLEYQGAAGKWWGGQQSLYQKSNGYLYLPQAAIIYSPYNILPKRVGEPLWRVTMLAALAWAIWLAGKRLAPAKPEAVFLAATALVLPSSFASARDGQMNMVLASLFLFTAVVISWRLWVPAAILLTLSLAFKPIAIAPLLLCGALYSRLRLPLLICIVVMLAAAYIHPDPRYVTAQYHIFVETFLRAGHPSTNNWCDFAGMLRTLGIRLPDPVHLLIRAIAALLTPGIAFVALRARDAARSSFTVMLFAVIYLMLFNPRTETNSYIILGGFVAVWCAVEGLLYMNLRRAAWLAAMALLLGSENYGPIYHLTNLWAKALGTLILGICLAELVLRAPKEEPAIMVKSR